MGRLRFACALAMLVACGLANPVAKHPDGTIPEARTRVGIASAKFVGDCTANLDCTVQLSMAHTGTRALHADVVAARVIVDGKDIGEVRVSDVTAWHRGAYRPWNHLIWPFRTTKLSVDLGPFDWEAKLAAHGIEDYRENIHIELELSIGGETVLTRSMFAVERAPPESHIFIVT